MSTRCACWMLYYYCSVSNVFDEYKMCLLDAVVLLPCFSAFDEYKMCLLDAVSVFLSVLVHLTSARCACWLLYYYLSLFKCL